LIGAWLDHLERRQPFGMTGDPRQSGVDEEPVAVLHQGMADEAELGFHAWAFAIEHGIRVARRDVRLVAPLGTAEVDLPIAPAAGRRLVVAIAAVSLSLRLFRLAQASMSVPSTEKCCDDNSRMTLGWVKMAARNLAASSHSRRRSRFFENTE
jgi:hypothetical protein